MRAPGRHGSPLRGLARTDCATGARSRTRRFARSSSARAAFWSRTSCGSRRSRYSSQGSPTRRVSGVRCTRCFNSWTGTASLPDECRIAALGRQFELDEAAARAAAASAVERFVALADGSAGGRSRASREGDAVRAARRRGRVPAWLAASTCTRAAEARRLIVDYKSGTSGTADELVATLRAAGEVLRARGLRGRVRRGRGRVRAPRGAS